MKTLRYLLPIALVAAAIAIPAANAAPSPNRISIASNAQYVTPTTVLVQVTYVCPLGSPFANVFVSLEQVQTLTTATGNGFTPAVCTGQAETAAVVVNGGPFTPGKAYARATICAGVFCDVSTRQVQIAI